MNNNIDLQIACQSDALPTLEDFQLWVDLVLTHQELSDQEMTIRIVENEESQTLNATYRGKDKPTNVLSFPFEAPPGVPIPLLGDLVVCHTVVAAEAKEQQKPLLHHWAHMIIHGTLHLLGFDHMEEHEALKMESLEIHLLSQLSIDDPYQDH